MIDIYVDGRSLGTKGAGLSIWMQCGKREFKYSVKTEKLTSNQLELKAIEFALKAVKPEYRSEKITIRSSGRFAILMLEKYDNGWLRNAKANTSLVDEVRSNWLKFENLKLNTDISSQVMSKLKSITDATVKSGVTICEQI